MTNDNSYLLEYDGLIPVKEGAFKGHLWAEPSESHLRHLLRHVYEHRKEAKARGNVALDDMVRQYAPRVMGQVVADHLRRIEDIRESVLNHG